MLRLMTQVVRPLNLFFFSYRGQHIVIKINWGQCRIRNLYWVIRKCANQVYASFHTIVRIARNKVVIYIERTLYHILTYSKQYGSGMKVVSLTYHCMYFKVAMILHIFMYNCISSSLTKYWFDFRQKMDRQFFNVTEIQRWDYNLGLTHKWYLNIFYTKLGIKILLPMISPQQHQNTHCFKSLSSVSQFRFVIHHS